MNEKTVRLLLRQLWCCIKRGFGAADYGFRCRRSSVKTGFFIDVRVLHTAAMAK
jgi:hypothetical protein